MRLIRIHAVQPRIHTNKEPFSKPGSSRGNEAQAFRKSEPPHVGCYGFERASKDRCFTASERRRKRSPISEQKSSWLASLPLHLIRVHWCSFVVSSPSFRINQAAPAFLRRAWSTWRRPLSIKARTRSASSPPEWIRLFTSSPDSPLSFARCCASLHLPARPRTLLLLASMALAFDFKTSCYKEAVRTRCLQSGSAARGPGQSDPCDAQPACQRPYPVSLRQKLDRREQHKWGVKR